MYMLSILFGYSFHYNTTMNQIESEGISIGDLDSIKSMITSAGS